MKEEELQLLKDVINQVGEKGSYVINAYTEWYFTNAVVWLFAGIVLFLFGILLSKFVYDELIKGLVLAGIILSLLVIFFNITNIFAPEGYAIYRLINDIKR